MGNFNPRAPYGARPSNPPSRSRSRKYFNPRAPYGARHRPRRWLRRRNHFNPRAPYGARPRRTRQQLPPDQISIHAPHTGRDRQRRRNWRSCISFQSTRPIRGATIRCFPVPRISGHFNPRAPYGARLQGAAGADGQVQFQSTRPIRGATQPDSGSRPVDLYFNPRAPYGARPWALFFT